MNHTLDMVDELKEKFNGKLDCGFLYIDEIVEELETLPNLPQIYSNIQKQFYSYLFEKYIKKCDYETAEYVAYYLINIESDFVFSEE